MNKRDMNRLDDLEQALDEGTTGIHTSEAVEVEGETLFRHTVSGNTYTPDEYEALMDLYPDALILPPANYGERPPVPYQDDVATPDDLYRENDARPNHSDWDVVQAEMAERDRRWDETTGAYLRSVPEQEAWVRESIAKVERMRERSKRSAGRKKKGRR